MAGMIPALGAIPDAINAGIYVIEGDWGNGGLSAEAAVPIFGDVPKGVSLARKAAKEVVQVTGEAVQRTGKEGIAKGLKDARAARQAEQAAAAEAKTAEKELVGEGFREGPARATRPGPAPKTGLDKAARGKSSRRCATTTPNDSAFPPMARCTTGSSFRS